MVYGKRTPCNNCGTAWNMYTDHDNSTPMRGGWAVGGHCPTCSTFRTIKITEEDFPYNVGDTGRGDPS